MHCHGFKQLNHQAPQFLPLRLLAGLVAVACLVNFFLFCCVVGLARLVFGLLCVWPCVAVLCGAACFAFCLPGLGFALGASRLSDIVSFWMLCGSFCCSVRMT